MAIRKKIYYPANQITENLFTKGKEYMLEDTSEEWIGYYHTYITGEIYTGKKWDENTSKPLIPFKDQSKSVNQYNQLKLYTTLLDGTKAKLIGPHDFSTYHAPKAVLVEPSVGDYRNGFVTRYFVTKRNEVTKGPFEIDILQKEEFDLKNKGINQILYKMDSVVWKLTGPEFDVIENGIIKIPGVVNTNLRSVSNCGIFGIDRVLTNPRQWTKWDVKK